jgi:peptide-methionine (S)-S-oxide reductase
MTRSTIRRGAALTAILAGSVFGLTRFMAAPAYASATLPDPSFDTPLSTVRGEQVAVFAGGCFWGIEAVFEHVKGVTGVVSGYAGGNVSAPSYEQVSDGTTGHAEAVQITFDSSKISYGTLLKVFFSVAHDPTQLNRQGPDVGTQYRSAIFYANDTQKQVANAYIAQLTKEKVFPRPIVTQVAPLTKFYMAEAYHQDYAAAHPTQPYIMIHDAPKVDRLRKQFPELYREPARN